MGCLRPLRPGVIGSATGPPPGLGQGMPPSLPCLLRLRHPLTRAYRTGTGWVEPSMRWLGGGDRHRSLLLCCRARVYIYGLNQETRRGGLAGRH
jgi:hypothetical protein